jgi:predicted phage tail protein
MIANAPLRNVRFYGRLAKKFGSEFRFAVRSPSDVVRLMDANFPEFCAVLRKGYYRVIVGDLKNGIVCDLRMTTFNFPAGDIHIMPVPVGAKNGGGKAIGAIILGVALVAVSMGLALAAAPLSLAPGAGLMSGLSAGLTTSTGIFGITYGQVAMFGLALTLSGVAALLTPVPKQPDSMKDKDTSSFMFNGALNLVTEGGPVPLIYGRILAGTVVVASGISVEKLDPTQNDNALSNALVKRDNDGDGDIDTADDLGTWPDNEGNETGVSDIDAEVDVT